MKRSRIMSAFTLIELLVVIAIIGILASFIAPSLQDAKKKALRQQCGNNLRSIGQALILYSNDHRFFPHMKQLNEANDPQDVSKVYRTLIYYKYIDNPEAYICPSSEDFFIQPDDEVINNPKQFQWGSPAPSGSNLKPSKGGTDPDVFQNSQLSYTYRKTRLSSAHARSSSLLAADKACKEGFDASDSGATDQVVGNHDDGFNVLYADGHVEFTLTAEGKKCRRLARSLHLGAFNPDVFDGN